MKIAFIGGSGRFGKIFKENTKLKKTLYPNKKELNILSIVSIHNYFKKHKPKVIIHAAGLSRPMSEHDTNITKMPMYQRARKGVGYLSQEPSVFTKLTVEDNLRLVLQMTSLTKDEQIQRLEKLIEDFSIGQCFL